MVDATLDRRSLWRAFAASLSGKSLEWYDFTAYSVAGSPVVLSGAELHPQRRRQVLLDRREGGGDVH
ncbi:hypothetical protein GCM10029964_001000 [Kibdelosporangium lantanae]